MATNPNAAFDIQTSTPSSPGYPGYDAAGGATLDLKLSRNPAPDITSCKYVLVSTDKGASLPTFSNSGTATPVATSTVTLTVPTGTHAYRIRCITNGGEAVNGDKSVNTQDRVVVVRSTLTGVRKMVVGETFQYDSVYGWTNILAELADAMEALATVGAPIPVGRVITAGAGMTGGGDMSADRTFDVVAGDGSLTIGPNSMTVGVISDAQHGGRGGGGLHADVVAGGASGFMSGSAMTKLNGIEAGAQQVNTARVVFALQGATTPLDLSGLSINAAGFAAAYWVGAGAGYFLSNLQAIDDATAATDAAGYGGRVELTYISTDDNLMKAVDESGHVAPLKVNFANVAAALGAATGNVSVNGHRLTGGSDPVASTDFSTKGYVDKMSNLIGPSAETAAQVHTDQQKVFVFQAAVAMTIAVYWTPVDAGVTASDTDYWQFFIAHGTAAGSVTLGTTASTKTIGGGGTGDLTARAPKLLYGTVFAPEDTLTFWILATGNPPDLPKGAVTAILTPT